MDLHGRDGRSPGDRDLGPNEHGAVDLPEDMGSSPSRITLTGDTRPGGQTGQATKLPVNEWCQQPRSYQELCSIPGTAANHHNADANPQPTPGNLRAVASSLTARCHAGGGVACPTSTAHASTLFTVFEPDVRVAELRDAGSLVTRLISRELLREQLPTDTFGRADPASVIIAKTADRSVLGCMNDMAFMCEIATTRSGGLAATDIADLNQALRRNINSARSHQPPIELIAQRLGP